MKTETDAAAVQSRFRGAMLGTMIGDALGAPVEGWDCDDLHALLADFPGLPRPQRETALAIFGLITGAPALPGMVAHYTDDTQMTIGVAQSLVSAGGVDEADMAYRFGQNFDPARGYGMGAHVVLSALRAGAKWDEPARKLFGGKGSWGNGAAMRAAPIGLFFQLSAPGVLRRAAERQAAVTHAHPLGKEGAVVQAAAVAVAACTSPVGDFDPLAFLQNVRALTGPLLAEYETGLQAVERLLANPPDVCAVATILGNGIEAHLSVPAALFAFLSHPDSFLDAVRYGVRMGGDADTIGAMCGAIAGAYHGEAGLPPAYLAVLENGSQGRDTVRDLADELFAAWRRGQNISAGVNGG